MSAFMHHGVAARRVPVLFVLATLPGCGKTPTGPGGDLGPQPVAVIPVADALVSTDTPVFTVRNAAGYDSGQAEYTFEVVTRGLGRTVASAKVPAGSGTTSLTFATPLPRGMNLSWRATASKAGGQTSSATTPFRMPAVVCLGTRDGYAHRIVGSLLPFCPRSPNVYNDANDVLGPPDGAEISPGRYRGFVSLGDPDPATGAPGYVSADMEACAQDAAGVDVRVFQDVGVESVSLYAGGTASGPWVPVEKDKPCDVRFPGGAGVIRYCDFDLAGGEVQVARYFKVEDGERFPCAQAATDSEGADIDAVQILSFAAATGEPLGISPAFRIRLDTPHP